MGMIFFGEVNFLVFKFYDGSGCLFRLFEWSFLYGRAIEGQKRAIAIIFTASPAFSPSTVLSSSQQGH